MQILERGVGENGDLLKGQWEAVRRLDGDNNAAMIERFKNMYGLNYTGASQVWAMMEKAGRENWTEQDWKKAGEDIKRFQETPDYQSDSATLQTLLNEAKGLSVMIGRIEFDGTEISAIRQSIDKIREKLYGYESPPDPEPGISEETMRSSPITQGGEVMGAAHSNVVLNTAHIQPDTEGLDKYYDIQERFRTMTEGLDPRRFQHEPNTIELGSFLTRAVADREFSEGEYREASRILDRLENTIAGMTEIFHAIEAQNERLLRDGIPLYGEINSN
jgi:hypothetical protein